MGSCSFLNKNRRTTSRSSPSKSLLYVAWLAPHLPWQGASDRERHRWSDSHPLKVVTADDVLVESANCSMQVPLNSNSDPSAWDGRLLAQLAVHGEPPRINLRKRSRFEPATSFNSMLMPCQVVSKHDDSSNFFWSPLGPTQFLSLPKTRHRLSKTVRFSWFLRLRHV